MNNCSVRVLAVQNQAEARQLDLAPSGRVFIYIQVFEDVHGS